MKDLKLSVKISISKTLNWDGMLVHIALPAIDRIISEYIFEITDVYGVPAEDVVKHLDEDMSHLDDDALFTLLANSWDNPEDRHYICELRGEIEHEMKDNHLSFEDAVREWVK